MNPIDETTLKASLGAERGDAQRAAQRFAQRAAADGLIDVAFATHETPLGTTILAATDRGLVRVALPGAAVDEVVEGLAAEVSPRVLELPARLDDVRRELDEYFAGNRERFDLALDWRLVRADFQRQVLRTAVSKLPFGVTASYGEVATWAGSPRAYRAAGTALARNPLPIVIPCHRVLRAGGAVGQYGGGPEMKRRLLRHEGALA